MIRPANAPMMSEKNVVSLIVKGDHSSALEVRVEVEQRGQKPLNGQAESGSEVVQNDLGLVFAKTGRISKLLAELHR